MHSFMYILILFLAFLLSGNVYSQTISTPLVSGTPVCGGSTVDIDFTVTNAKSQGSGNNSNKRFTVDTKYKVYIIGGGINEYLTGTFTSSSQPPGDLSEATAPITLTVPIPNDNASYPTSSDYIIRIISTAPDATSDFSSEFFINNDPTPSPSASTNSPVCEGVTIKLTASNITGATYYWTGPNGFTSNSQNPNISNVTTSMEGTYSVTATVDGCTSIAETANVVVNTLPTITSSTPGLRCGTGTVVLGATTSAGTINWYAAAIGGASLGTGTAFTTPSISSNTTYYVDATSNGCTTGTRTAVIATVNTIPSAPTAGSNSPVCIRGTINLTASSIADATYNWTGPNNYTSNLQNPIINNVDSSNSGDYFVTATVNGCTSETGTTNVIVINSNTWTGTQDSNWNEINNWSCSFVPDITTNVIIPIGLANYPIINTGTAGECKDLTIDSGSSLSVIDNTLNISGTITNNGAFEALNGTIGMLGRTSQTIPADTFVSNRIENLIINNVSGVSSLGNLEITGFLRVEQNLSTFDTGNKLTLISDATQTALIDGSGKGDVIGSVKMQRYLDLAFGYKYFSSPFSNSTVGDFSSYVDLGATFPQVYYYEENSTDVSSNDITGWKPYTSTASGLGTLEGYAFNFGTAGTTVTVELSGTVNNGNFTRSLSNNNGTYTDGYNLIGNPYPSPIDWNAPEWNKTNIDGAIYFFSASSQYKGTYSSYVNNVPSTADGISSNIIPSMQGFFVHVNDGGDNTSVTNGVLALTNEVRVNDFTQQFIKRSEPAPVSLIRLSAGIKNNSTKDAMVIYFDPFAKEGFEKDMDALKLINTDEQVPNLYSLTSESDKLSINALPESLKNNKQRVPLGINSEIDGEMSIQLIDLKNLPSNFNIYLIDEVKRIGQNLSEKPVYNFKINAGEYNSRFYLLFSEYELSDPALAFNEPFSVKTINGKVYVNLNLEEGTSGTLMATNVTGQILVRRNVTGNETISLDGIKSSGIYFIKLSWKDQHFSKKIIIQK